MAQEKLPRSWKIATSDSLYSTEATKSYLYDCALSIIATVGKDKSLSDSIISGTILSQTSGNFPFVADYSTASGSLTTTNNSTIAMMAYALGYYLEINSSTADFCTIETTLRNALQHLHTQRDWLKNKGLIYYSSGDQSINTEVNLLTYFAFKQAAKVLNNPYYIDATNELETTIVSELWASDKFSNSIATDGTVDSTNYLQNYAYGALFFSETGDTSKALTCLLKCELFACIDDNIGVSGYKRDLNNSVNNVWFEMSYAVAIAYYKLNSINKFNSIVTALNKFSNADAGFTGTLVKDYANENMISYEAIGSTAWSLIGNNLSNLAFKIRTSLSPLSACTVPFYNDEQHQVFTKTGCTGTDTPTTYDYHVPQGRYMSYTSKDDANNIALNEISTFGQAYVNLYGQCVPAANVGNDVQSQDFTKNNCASGYHGSVVTMTVAANTYYASTKEDANILATNYILANGQNNANTYGTCIIDNSNNDVSVNYITATNQFQAFSSLPVNTDINIVYTIFDSTGANIANDGVTIYTGDTSSAQVDNVEAGNSPYHATIMSITPSSYNGMTYTF